MRYTTAQQIGRKIAKLRNDGYDETSDSIILLRADLKKLTDIYLLSQKETIVYSVHLFTKKKTSESRTDLLSIFEKIKSPQTKHLTNQYAQMVKSNTLYKTEFINECVKYTPCGLFYTSNNRIDIQKLNGILMLKSNDNKINEKEIIKIKSCTNTFAFYKQLAKDQYIILVKTDGLTKINYSNYQIKIENYYAELIGKRKLIAPGINDVVYLSHDETLYLNLNSKQFK